MWVELILYLKAGVSLGTRQQQIEFLKGNRPEAMICVAQAPSLCFEMPLRLKVVFNRLNLCDDF